MEVGQALDLSREALVMTLIIAGPVLGVGIVVGLLISIVQTVTQIQDQTLSIVPKIVAMVAAAVFFVPWLAQRVLNYSQDMFGVF
jgi:flagellar biosynthetic protein FliQ